jgi:hypothetical protein
VGVAHLAEAPAGNEPLARVLPKGFQQPIAVAGGVGLDHRLVDQLLDQVQCLECIQAGDRGHGLQVELPGEHAERVEQRPFRTGEQVIGPADRPLQGLLARNGGAAAPGEQPEPLVKVGGDLVDREHLGPGGGQLDGQRDAVQATADFDDIPCVRRSEDETGARGVRAVVEEPDADVVERSREVR